MFNFADIAIMCPWKSSMSYHVVFNGYTYKFQFLAARIHQRILSVMNA